MNRALFWPLERLPSQVEKQHHSDVAHSDDAVFVQLVLRASVVG